jgi:hypothetical protein
VLPESAVVVDPEGIRRVYCDVCGGTSLASPLLAALIAGAVPTQPSRRRHVEAPLSEDA